MVNSNESFVFYDSFFETYQAIKVKDPEQAIVYLESVIEYGLTGECTSKDQMIYALMVQSKNAIRRAVARRDLAIGAGAAGGKTQKNHDDIIWPLLDQGLSQVEIARQTGLTTKTVYRSKVRKIAAEEQKTSQPLQEEDIGTFVF